MTQISKFESRTGRLNCKPAEVFEFVTDIRNFRQFVRNDSVDNLHIEKDSCSFHISPLGNVNLNILKKEPNTHVSFSGSALKSNDFSLLLDIRESHTGNAEVRVILNAEMNPFLKMMASKPVTQFLETLIDEMERFNGWKEFKA
jgi:carbon monoxide dehydrogenase subunit G